MEEQPKFDARLEEGVSYFEEMLKIMPEDRTTLEFLVVAYEQMGQREKSENALVSLANLLIKQNDLTAAEALLPRLESAALSAAKVLALRVKRLIAPAPDLTPEVPKALTESEIIAEISRKAVESEISLVRDGLAQGALTAADAETVEQQLKDSPADGRLFLISALSILEKENQAAAEKALAYLADRSGLAPVPLEAFEPRKDLAAGFPADLMRVRGFVPFAKLGETVLVAMLNPLDDELRAQLSEGRKCNFYLASASAVEQHLAKFFEGEEKS